MNKYLMLYQFSHALTVPQSLMVQNPFPQAASHGYAVIYSFPFPSRIVERKLLNQGDCFINDII